jgi:hypothetical protein
MEYTWTRNCEPLKNKSFYGFINGDSICTTLFWWLKNKTLTIITDKLIPTKKKEKKIDKKLSRWSLLPEIAAEHHIYE